MCTLAVFCALVALPGPAQTSQPSTPAVAQSEASKQSGTLAKYEGETVTSIDFRGTTGIDTETLRALIVQKADQPLDRDKLHASIEALYATGRFATLQVEAEADPAANHAIKLVFAVTQNYFNGAVTVDGTPQKTNPKANQLVAASQLDLGSVFSEDKAVSSIDRMKKIFADNGYYQATITYTLEPSDTDSLMAIHFHAVPGPLARIGNVSIQGDTGIPPGQVRSLTKLKAGSKVVAEHVTRALERLRKHYQKNDHLEAQVSLIDRQYHAATNQLDYIFQVDQGPTVNITTEGGGVSKGQLKKLVPVYQENSVDDDLLNEGRRNLRDYLQTKGYFDATVEVQRHPVTDENHVNIVYVIDPGIRHKLVSIKVEGNKYFNTATIRERMAVEPSSVLLAQWPLQPAPAHR